MSCPRFVHVITGANKGIGLGLFRTYLSRPNTTVVGIVRSTDAANSLKAAGEAIPSGSESNYHVVILDFAKITAPEAALKDFHAATCGEIDEINTLICSAGHVTPADPTLTMKPEHLRECFEVNTIGTLNAFQTLWPLLHESSSCCGPPKYIVLSSSVGSIGAMEPFPGGAYVSPQ